MRQRQSQRQTETETAVDWRARVQIECQAKKAFGASPWNEDKDVSDVVLRSRRVIMSLLRV